MIKEASPWKDGVVEFEEIVETASSAAAWTESDENNICCPLRRVPPLQASGLKPTETRRLKRNADAKPLRMKIIKTRRRNTDNGWQTSGIFGSWILVDETFVEEVATDERVYEFHVVRSPPLCFHDATWNKRDQIDGIRLKRLLCFLILQTVVS